ncbi:hypothetical protein Tco_1125156 [Tanacetum coccineum]|uniref:Uncharacterized protein n=1 Tax=Tanacetum coccineum TaxID=301880 RepID=A0ABQ5J868_9ASTR
MEILLASSSNRTARILCFKLEIMSRIFFQIELHDHRYKRWCCSLVLAKSDSLPHAHAQSFKSQTFSIKTAAKQECIQS